MVKTDGAINDTCRSKEQGKCYDVFLNFGDQDALSSFTSREETYDVFLSFRGDTRKKFADHLYRALVDHAGLRVFRDTEIEPGEDIRSALSKAIQKSKLSLIVFSGEYAASKWCLDELVMILERRRNSRHQVFPVFYNVTPEEVKKQNGCFQNAFNCYEEKIKSDIENTEWKNTVCAWRAALRQVGNIVGKVFKSGTDGYEGKFVRKIVRMIKKRFRSKHLDLQVEDLSSNVEETCKTFNNLLSTTLCEAGFCTFRDDNYSGGGEGIYSELLTAIQNARFFIVVFSRSYPYSECCLDELVNILEHKKNSGQKILPIFYEVDPWDVKHQSGSLEKAFDSYEGKSRASSEIDDESKQQWKNKVHGWRVALREVACLPGIRLQSTADGHVYEVINKIVTVTRDLLIRTALPIENYIVGLHSRAKSINRWLHDKSSTVQILVICGMSGIGKSTIAKFVYNANYHLFEYSIFLANIREVCNEPNGLLALQSRLLPFHLGKVTPHNANTGTETIGRAIHSLIVLDDVCDGKQLNMLLGTGILYPGSKIIVTTRNRWILSARDIHDVYMVEKLNEEESLELLSWHAFGDDHPKEGYVEESVEAIKHCGGLPLAIKDTGSSLRERIERDQWEYAGKKFEAEPETQIFEKLKISYDSLQDGHDKRLFLHIACFYVGEDKDCAIEILDKSGFFAAIGIQNLVDRCLLIINNNKLMMHRSLQQMAREIVLQESPNELGKTTSLCPDKSSFDMVKKMKGTNNIEGLALDMHMFNENKPGSSSNNCLLNFFTWQSENEVSQEDHGGVELSVSALSQLKTLKILKLNNVHLTGNYKKFPRNLIWLSWHSYPWKRVPAELPLEHLVSLDMRNSKLEEVWKDTRYLPLLKVMNFSHSSKLIRTPNFSGIRNVERLYLAGCSSLCSLPDSIGKLTRLVVLNLRGCSKLRKLPDSIDKLINLETLDLTYCSRLEEIPELDTRNLRWLSWSSFRWKSVPAALSLEYLVSLDMRYSKLEEVWTDTKYLPSLKLMDLSYSLELIKTPDFSGILNLEELALEGCLSLRSLPDSIGKLTRLETLNLRDCSRLRNIPDFIFKLTSLRVLDLPNCLSLEEIPELDISQLVKSVPDMNSDHETFQQEGSAAVEMETVERSSQVGDELDTSNVEDADMEK